MHSQKLSPFILPGDGDKGMLGDVGDAGDVVLLRWGGRELGMTLGMEFREDMIHPMHSREKEARVGIGDRA